MFNDGAFEWGTNRDTKADTIIEIEHGKPLIFGKNRDKGIRLNGMQLEVVDLGKGIEEDDLLFHDEKMQEPALAYLLSRMRHPEFPEPIGVFRDVDRPRYEERMTQQIEEARAKRPGNLERCSIPAILGLWIRIVLPENRSAHSGFNYTNSCTVGLMIISATWRAAADRQSSALPRRCLPAAAFGRGVRRSRASGDGRESACRLRRANGRYANAFRADFVGHGHQGVIANLEAE